jgi:hypothetical protein
MGPLIPLIPVKILAAFLTAVDIDRGHVEFLDLFGVFLWLSSQQGQALKFSEESIHEGCGFIPRTILARVDALFAGFWSLVLLGRQAQRNPT